MRVENTAERAITRVAKFRGGRDGLVAALSPVRHFSSAKAGAGMRRVTAASNLLLFSVLTYTAASLVFPRELEDLERSAQVKVKSIPLVANWLTARKMDELDAEDIGLLYAISQTQGDGGSRVVSDYLFNYFKEGFEGRDGELDVFVDRMQTKSLMHGAAGGWRTDDSVIAYFDSEHRQWTGFEGLMASLSRRVIPMLIKMGMDKKSGEALPLLKMVIDQFPGYVEYKSCSGASLENKRLIDYCHVVDSYISFCLVKAVPGAADLASEKLASAVKMIEEHLQNDERFKGKSLVEIANIVKGDESTHSNNQLFDLLMMAQRLTYLRGRIFFYDKARSIELHQGFFEQAIAIGAAIDPVGPRTWREGFSLQSLLARMNGLYFTALDIVDNEKLSFFAKSYEELLSNLKKKGDEFFVYDISKETTTKSDHYSLAECAMMAAKIWMRYLSVGVGIKSLRLDGEHSELISRIADLSTQSMEYAIAGEKMGDGKALRYRRSFLRVMSFFELIVAIEDSKEKSIEEMGDSFARGKECLRTILGADEYDFTKKESALISTTQLLSFFKNKLIENGLGDSFQMAQLLMIYAKAEHHKGGGDPEKIRMALQSSYSILTQNLHKGRGDADVEKLLSLMEELGVEPWTFKSKVGSVSGVARELGL